MQYLIDASVYVFRAYYSMPDLRTPDGAPIGAMRGYTAALIKFLTRQQPTHVASFSEIIEVSASFEESWLFDSGLHVILEDGNQLLIPLSSEAGGDVRFIAEFKRRFIAAGGSLAARSQAGLWSDGQLSIRAGGYREEPRGLCQ